MKLIQWKIIQVIPETADTKTYVLEALQGKPVEWQAGQFLTFIFTHDRDRRSFGEGGQELRRSYSTSSTPGIDKHISITVKRKVNGEVSRHIFDTWQTGTMVSSLPPAGLFTITTDASVKRHIYCIAAGSGIVPIFGLIKKILVQEPLSHITLLYQNRDEHHIIYREPLQQLHALYPQRLTRINLLSNPIDHYIKPMRLNNWLLEYLLAYDHRPQTARPLFYTCGPESFMRMVQFTLRVMGFSEDQLRKEHFVIEAPRKPAFTMPPHPRQVVLRYGGQTYRFTSTYPHTILKAAQHQGIELPYSCNTGRCGTCTARCHTGVVKMSNNEVLTDADLQQGLVLTCVGYAETDVELEM
jgi:Flavodoxin reductases (ferredoxin-NADPH reductases) family 1